MESNKRVAGSVKNKITATELVEERKRLDFDVTEFQRAAWGENVNTLKVLD